MSPPPAFQLSKALIVLTCAASLGLGTLATARASQFKVLHQFTGPDGLFPASSLLVGPGGVLYGVTEEGGAHGGGVVFQLTPPAAGQSEWTETVLHSFGGSVGDGDWPMSNLAMDKFGALYGTTSYGGSLGGGTAFKLTPPAAGGATWTEKVVYSFNGLSERPPQGHIYLDSGGRLFGTAAADRATVGEAFLLTPQTSSNQPWVLTIMALFSSSIGNGAQVPFGGLTLGADGSFYGTTKYGDGCGTVYRLTAPASTGAPWSKQTIHGFCLDASGNYSSYTGIAPVAAPVGNRANVLYGTTSARFVSGSEAGGTVYRLIPPAPGQSAWTESDLYKFEYHADLEAGVLEGPAGALYGVTRIGGSSTNCGSSGCGTVFKLAPAGDAGKKTPWTRTILHSFTGYDGDFPVASLGSGLLADGTFALFGTAKGDGGYLSTAIAHNDGAVFEVIP